MIIYIDENDENKRLDSYLSEITPDFSRSKIQNFIKSGNVKINNTIKKPSYVLKENDKIDFEIPEEKKFEIKPQDIPIEIVYEDEMLYIFDLLETEIFLDVRKTETQKAGVQAGASKGTENAQKMIMEGIDLTSHGDDPPVSMRERKAYYPADWRDSFGLPVEEHSRTLQIDIKDGYAEFNVFSDHKGDSTPSSGRRADE